MYTPIPFYFIFDIIFILGVIIFVTIDLIKSKSVVKASNEASVFDGASEQENKRINILRGVSLSILQFLLLLFAIGRHSLKIFLAIEIVAVPIILIHILFISKKQNNNLSKMNNLSKIGGLIAYLYCKVLLFIVFKAITHSVIYYGSGILLIILLEALSIYIAVSHLIIGVNRKKYITISQGDKYSDLNFLFTEAKMKSVIIIGSIGAFLRLAACFIPYVFKPGINIVADILIAVFLESCLLKIKKWSFIKVTVLISLFASIASIIFSLIVTSPEFNYNFSRLYFIIFINLSYVSILLYIAFPLGLIISKPKALIVTITSCLSAGYSILVLVLSFKRYNLRTSIYTFEELLFSLVFISILFLKNISKKKNTLSDSSV